MKSSLSVTVIIPTCYGGKSLIKAVRSIYASSPDQPFSLIIAADTTPIEKPILKELRELGAKVIENKQPGSQQSKLNQMTVLSQSDITITTQDDIRFAPGTIKRMVEAFTKDRDLTMIGPRILPEAPNSLFQKVIQVGNRLTERIALQWRNGDNFLLANGRCLAFRTAHLKKFSMPDRIINGDALYYFENKRFNGKFLHLPTAVVYNKSPAKLKEHLNQTKRFAYSQQELSALYKKDISEEYLMPKGIVLSALMAEFLHNPIATIGYCLINLYAKVQKKDQKKVANPLWGLDVSTKLN